MLLGLKVVTVISYDLPILSSFHRREKSSHDVKTKTKKNNNNNDEDVPTSLYTSV